MITPFQTGSTAIHRSWENYVLNVLEMVQSSVNKAIIFFETTVNAQRSRDSDYDSICSHHVLAFKEHFVVEATHCVTANLTCYFYYTALAVIDRPNHWSSMCIPRYGEFFNALFHYFVTLLFHSYNEEVRLPHCSNIREDNMKSLLVGSVLFSRILQSRNPNSAWLPILIHWVEMFSNQLRNHSSCFLYIPSVIKIRMADLFSNLFVCARHYAMAEDNAAAKDSVTDMRKKFSNFLINLIR